MSIPNLRSTKTDLPDGFTLEADGDLFWVVRGSRRYMTVSSREEGIKQAWLMVAFEVREGTDRWLRDWSLAGAFEFIKNPPNASDPKPVWPRFGFYFNWTYRIPIFRLLISADFASYLIWRQLHAAPSVERVIRETNEDFLVWSFFYLTRESNRGQGIYAEASSRSLRPFDFDYPVTSYDPEKNRINFLWHRAHVDVGMFMRARKELAALLRSLRDKMPDGR